MLQMFEYVRSLFVWSKVNSKRGVTAIEYGLLAALISIVIIAAVTTLGQHLTAVFTTISSKVHG